MTSSVSSLSDQEVSEDEHFDSESNSSDGEKTASKRKFQKKAISNQVVKKSRGVRFFLTWNETHFFGSQQQAFLGLTRFLKMCWPSMSGKRRYIRFINVQALTSDHFCMF